MAHRYKKQVALYLTEAEIEKISIFAEKYGVSRTRLMSSLIIGGMELIKNDAIEGLLNLKKVDC